MGQVIAGLYEIREELGSGGGGVVYLGWHLRMEKSIVLKADKRSLNTKMEKLRREVDMLKGLSHMYIPQVYDFVQENGVVYTVMEFIDGESLNKVLERGERVSQPQVIKWACQLLEALCYLHSRPPYGILHGDIKPANIMFRPNGDICLIDYNIALALGEDGAVKVGFSRGYASPEHYGTEFVNGDSSVVGGWSSYIRGKRWKRRGEEQRDVEKTLVDDEETVADTNVSSSDSDRSTTSGQRKVLLDVRSDIYSLGATLYHLLSGQRPAQDAREVEVLKEGVCSLAVSEIVQKAMNPDPAMRYQSAEEMLKDFRQIHKRDKRTIRYKRYMVAAAMVLSVSFLTGGACSFLGLKQIERRKEALALAEYSANALAEGNVVGAIELALQAIPMKKSIFEAEVTAEAQKALTDALEVYNLEDGFKAWDMIELPSAPFKVVASPEGSCFAVVYAYEVAVFRMEDGQGIVRLPVQNSALSDVVFVSETQMVYAGEQGVMAYDLKEKKVLWTGEVATTLTISGDRRIVAAINRDEDDVMIYQVSDGKKVMERSLDGMHLSVAVNDTFADPENDIFALNEDGSILAISFSNGGIRLLVLENPWDDIIILEESDYVHFEGGFCGKYFAFAANKDGEAVFQIVDAQEAVLLGVYDSRDELLLQADERGFYLAEGNLLLHFDSVTLEQMELAFMGNANIKGFSVGKDYVLVGTDEKQFSFFDRGAHLSSSESCTENCDFVVLTDEYAMIGNRSEPFLRMLKLENHKEAQLLEYDARYAHEEARISQDGETVMLFDYQGFCIYRMSGELVTQVELPDKEQIYDQQFVKGEGDSWLEVIWYDGMVRCYSARDGGLILEEVREAPSKDLYEEFYTSKYQITSPLHGTPEVYSLETGKLVAMLEQDSYLTYVTEEGNYLITEYISAEGERYGLVLDEKFQTLAYLPNLCDVKDGMLVFDYEAGNLRQSRLYSLSELIEIGENYIENNRRENGRE